MAGTDGDVDAILKLIGLGRWQNAQCLWLFLFYLSWSTQMISIVVIGYVPDFTCVQNHLTESGNWSTPHLTESGNWSTPHLTESGNWSTPHLTESGNWSTPHLTESGNWSTPHLKQSGNWNSGDLLFDNKCSWHNTTTNGPQSCADEYMYKDPKHSSLVSEWDLVCGKSFLAELSQSVLTIGFALGALVFPQLSDRYGRRPIVLSCHAAFAIVSVATAFVPNIWVFIAARILIGALLSGAGTISWVMTLEMFIPKDRTMAALISNVVWALCVCALPMIGYLMDGMSWRYVQVAFSVFSLVWIGQILTLTESVRWLLANGKKKEALRIVKIAIRINRTDQASVEKLLTEYFHDMDSMQDKPVYASNIPVETELETISKPFNCNSNDPVKPELGTIHKPFEDTPTSENRAQVSVTQLFTHPVLRKVTLIMSLAWFTNSLTYFGIFMLSSTMSGSRYLNLLLNSAVEIPASIILFPLTIWFGRRIPCVVFHALGGLSLIVAAFLHATTSGCVAGVIQTCVVIFGKFCISSTFMIIFMYTPELYPTNVRSIGLGFADVAGRIGGFVAPFAATVAREVPWAPVCVFGVLCLLVSVACVFLPETANKEMPQTIEDLDSFTKETKNNHKNKQQIL